ncbi:MAG: hypothetical protein PHZ07_05155 [Patescibacteria group bacterium]|nr:hypothetical protein [Patescibacteria group bacterium]MDD4304812.1 hypothetical protein [Patescibacteria group bacterium]MDD4695858.1 hypothetical protein [Patescibacteria group bacterium]
MKKNVQMIIFVFVSFLFILILWFQFFIKNISKNNPPNLEIENIKNSITETLEQLNINKKISDAKSSINEMQKIADQKTNETKTLNDKNELIIKVSEKIENYSNKNDNTIEYQYEPWNIKFNYKDDMTKKVISESKKIEINNISNNDIMLTISRENKKIENAINTSKYTKTIFNNSNFFETKEQNINDIYRKDYYTQIDEYVYKIEIKCPYEKVPTYWDQLNQIAKSLSKLSN